MLSYKGVDRAIHNSLPPMDDVGDNIFFMLDEKDPLNGQTSLIQLGRKTSSYERIAADAYMTPKWVTESLLTKWTPRNPIWEPACGTCNIAEVLYSADYDVFITDLYDYGVTQAITGRDFLLKEQMYENSNSIVTNPPYALISEFIIKAKELTNPVNGCFAFLLRHEWDAPKSHRPYLEWPYCKKLILPKRPRWIEGTTGAPRHPYAWYVWDWQAPRSDPTTVFLD